MKRNILKVLVLLIAAVLLTSNVACVEFEKAGNIVKLTPTPNPVADDLKGEISFSTYKSFENDESVFNYIAAFNSQYPGVEVDYEELTEEEYFATLDERILDGSIGDVFVVDSERLAKYAKMGLLVDMTPYLEGLISYDDFSKLVPEKILYDKAYDACLYNGEYYMSAVEYSHEFVFINYSFFEEANLKSPGDKWTWDELYEYADVLSRLNSVKAAVVMDYDDYAVWGAFARSYGDYLFDVDSFDQITNVNLTNSNVIKGLQELAEFVSSGCVADLSVDDLEGKDLKDYGMVICDRKDFERWAQYLKSDNVDFNWDLMHFPRFVRQEENEKGEVVDVTYYNIGAKAYGFAVRTREGMEQEEYDEYLKNACTFALYSLEKNAAIKYTGEGEIVPALIEVNSMKFWREYPVQGKNTSVFTLFDANDYAAFLTPYISYESSLEFDVGSAIKSCVENDVPLRESLQIIQDAVNSLM